MPDNKNKRCPACGGGIDYFGSCRRCGREWSPALEEDELAEGLPEGKQHPSEVEEEKPKKPARNRNTKSSGDKRTLWRIDASDDETEIIRKRSLMRLDSRKTYNAMGLSLRAHEAQKASLLWLSKLWEFLSEEEREALAPAVSILKLGYAELKRVAEAKVNEAAAMEIEMEKEYRAARQARQRLMAAEAKRRAEDRSKVVPILPHEDTEGYGNPEPATVDPKALETLSKDDLMEIAKERLANIDQEKALRKRADRPEGEDGDPEGE